MQSLVTIELDYTKVVNFAMQQNRIPVIRNLHIINNSDEFLADLEVEVLTKPDFAAPLKISVSSLGPGQNLDLSSNKLALEPAYFMALTERIAGSIVVKVTTNGTQLAALERELDVLAYNEWGGGCVAPELLAAFVTPNHPLVAQIQRRAAEKMAEWTGEAALCAYQKQNENDVRRQLAAVFAALQELDIAYAMPPAGFETSGQKVRLADDIMTQKLGTCLDLSLLYASCVEALGLNALIIFIEGHAFAGAWLVDETFPSPCQDDFSLLSKRFSASVGEISVVECTHFSAGRTVDFAKAEAAAKDHFLNEDKFRYYIDIKAARVLGIKPLPQRKFDENGHLIGLECGNEDQEKTITWKDPAALDIIKTDNDNSALLLDKKTIWQNRLLNLSVRNSLLNFKIGSSAIQLVCDNLSQFEDALADKEEFRIMEFFPTLKKELLSDSFNRLVEESELGDLLQTEFNNRRLRTFYTEAETNKRIISLYRSAKSSLEENGANTLYLALGFLKWYESALSEKARYAPLVLLPLEITRKSAKQGYVIKARDEDTQFNITLLEKLRLEFKININGLDPLPLDDSGVDLNKIFATVRRAVMEQKRWDVEEIACIGQFSFSQFIMWNDLNNRMTELENHPIIQSLIAGKPMGELPPLIEVNSLDETVLPADAAVPLSADSSQLAAICSAGKGASFVLHGPPGTGKSQTITNMIANALFKGQSVLFIAEKMAALSVVQKRLEKIGLGPFCLELHSNKANKSSVTKQLQDALEFGRGKSPEEYIQEADLLHKQRTYLNGIMEKVHRCHHSGKSLYQVIGIYESHSELLRKIEVPSSIVNDADGATLQQMEAAVNALAVAAKDNGDLATHPLKEWTASQYLEQRKEEVTGFLAKFAAQVQKFKALVLEFGQTTPFINLETASSFTALEVLCANLDKVEIIPRKLLGKMTGFSSLDDFIKEGLKLNGLKNELDKQFENEIYDLDAVALRSSWKEGECSWFIPRFFKQNKILKTMRGLAKEPKSITRDNVVKALQNIIDAQKTSKFLATGKAEMAELLGDFWRGEKSDWALISRQKEVARILNGQVAVLVENKDGQERLYDQLADLAKFAASRQTQLSAILDNYKEIMASWSQLANLVSITTPLQYGPNWADNLAGRLSTWQQALPRWRYWCLYQDCRQKIVDLGLLNVANALETGMVTVDNVVDAFKVNVAYNLAVKYIDEDGEFAKLTATMMEHEIANYRSAIKNFENLTKKELIARLAANIPTANFASESSEVGILKKAIASKCRGKSIRQLFDSIPNLLRKLTPCMLMSPISVAQFIDPKFPKFDLIIFDEASQLPTCEAVGAIGRGHRLVVVGDPKQLPPTSFFKKDYVDEDNLDKEDLDSILDDCLAISLPEMHLQWHYRSKDESLITFSNYCFYEQKLCTFPSPTSLAGHVRFIPISGTYDKSRTRQNMAEALAIVDEIVRRLKDPLLRNKSLGVVTFSVVQQHLIEDLLEQKFAAEPNLEEFAKAAGEPIFVKNLENVQGDERDVIMFSIGYGPDANGQVSMNFGPINNAGGERRLNVAVSRAREDLLIFSTLNPEQIDLNRTASVGVAELKYFLQFAKNGKSALSTKEPPVNSVSQKDYFIESVAAALETAGLKAVKNVGCSKFKMDLAILNPKDPQQYILGILCDGENYKNSATAKDRNVLQQEVLEGLGWNIMRLMAVEWFMSRDNRSAIISAIKDRVAELVAKKEVVEPEPEVIAENTETIETSTNNEEPVGNGLPQYEMAALPSDMVGSDIYDCANSRILQEQIRQLVTVEGPISEMVLLTRLAELWGQKKTSKFYDKVINTCLALKFFTRVEQGRVFYCPDESDELVIFRAPTADFRRGIGEISLRELGYLIKMIVDEQLGIEFDELARLVLKCAGYKNCTAQSKAIVEEAVDFLVEHGHIRRQGSRLVTSA